ncbi:hypothetical protein [Candidatus Nanohalovita haloferacivicina]|uniref:hypothetical protein n=1 Tax=Candidatus Nanohalovita haloferacivicina TaxID=2978046 RepID=UPI00325FCF46|nr:hypothetical protein HBNXNv_0310 [Candidatus Nanohalobia archaeon BNXNv]
MKKHNKKALKNAAAGIATVLFLGLLVDIIAPETQAGQWLRFITPLATGTVAGIWIYWKLSEEIEHETTQ